MPELVYYPINDYDPAMKGMVVAAVAILHVFLAQFAIGGGALLCYFQWLAQTGREPLARRFTDGYFQVLVLASFVLGALTGVGIWFTVIQISPPTIGAMVKEFHWVWATEWTFFCLEVTAGYCFYRYKKVLNDRTRMTLLVIYTTAAWFSLFWINGILSWQLTPGEWIETRSMWAGFFNPGFWPTTLYRTVVCLTIASIVACILVNTMKDTTREEKQRLIHESAKLMFPMILMPLLGGWYLWTMPEDSRSWALGGSMTIMMFFNIAIGASALIGGYALIGLIRQRLYINGATATLLAVLAFGATAGGEFVREGVRKPYTVRKFMYSNSVRPEQVAKLREVGSTTNDPYPLKDPDRYPTKQLQLGAKVYRFQCSICHTIEGANALTDLAGSLTIDQARLNIAALQHTKPFMPPFCGTAEELEALVQLIAWSTAGSPPTWPETKDPKVIAQIQTWLDRAGVDRGTIDGLKAVGDPKATPPAAAAMR